MMDFIYDVITFGIMVAGAYVIYKKIVGKKQVDILDEKLLKKQGLEFNKNLIKKMHEEHPEWKKGYILYKKPNVWVTDEKYLEMLQESCDMYVTDEQLDEAEKRFIEACKKAYKK